MIPDCKVDGWHCWNMTRRLDPVLSTKVEDENDPSPSTRLGLSAAIVDQDDERSRRPAETRGGLGGGVTGAKFKLASSSSSSAVTVAAEAADSSLLNVQKLNVTLAHRLNRFRLQERHFFGSGRQNPCKLIVGAYSLRRRPLAGRSVFQPKLPSCEGMSTDARDTAAVFTRTQKPTGCAHRLLDDVNPSAEPIMGHVSSAVDDVR